jgi:hypothetical protein
LGGHADAVRKLTKGKSVVTKEGVQNQTKTRSMTDRGLKWRFFPFKVSPSIDGPSVSWLFSRRFRMNPIFNTPQWSKRALLAAAAASVVLAACGGGSNDAATTSGAANAGPDGVAYAAGPITGLGSIIVNGVRYDDSAARVEDDHDGSRLSSSELKLGVMVEISSSRPDDSTGRATASVVRMGSEIVGPISAVDAGAQTVTILGQTVEITATTVFDDSLGTSFAALTVGKVVEVHALFNATTNRYVATRVEDKAANAIYRLRGVVSDLDTAAKTFKLGAAVISYGSVPAAGVPATLANGSRVRVQLQTTQVNGQWVATSLGGGVKRVNDTGDARLRGLVSGLVSPQSFEINGLKVDATNASFKPSTSAVVAGARVDVRGSVVNGVLVASRVDVKGASEDIRRDVELHGALSALDTAAKTFTVRDVKVDYATVTEWKDGAAADLVNGRRVEVKGTWSANRTVLRADKVEFEN